MRPRDIVLFCVLLLFAPHARPIDDIPPPPPEPKGPRKPVTKSEFFIVTCKIYINEDGTAKTVEAISTSPPMNLHNRRNKGFVESILQSVRTWTFNPNKENGKAVPGYAIVPVSVDLAEPFHIGGGT